MRISLLFALLLGAPAFTLQAQSAPSPAPLDPELHKRAESPPDAVPVAATGHTDLPPAAEGEYPWNSIGGIITIYFQDGKLHGYMNDPMDPNPQVAAPTLPFATTHVEGNAVQWTTHTVHGKSYSFAGRLERGAAAAPTLSGYYVLIGTLTQQGGQAGHVVRTVSLKRMPATP